MKALYDQQHSLEQALDQTEQQILEAETQYLENTGANNVVHGWDGYLDKPKPASLKRPTRISKEHRIFSNSSATAPVPTDNDSDGESGSTTEARKKFAMAPPKRKKRKRKKEEQ